MRLNYQISISLWTQTKYIKEGWLAISKVKMQILNCTLKLNYFKELAINKPSHKQTHYSPLFKRLDPSSIIPYLVLIYTESLSFVVIQTADWLGRLGGFYLTVVKALWYSACKTVVFSALGKKKEQQNLRLIYFRKFLYSKDWNH